MGYVPADPQPRSRWWRRRAVEEDRSLSRETLPPVLAPAIAAAESINGRTVLGLSDAFACIRALADGAVLCTPLRFYRNTEAGRVELSGGRGPNLLRRPQPGVTQAGLVAQLVAHLAAWGECFVGKVRAGDELIQLEALPPDRMVVKIVSGEPVFTYYSPLNGVFDGLSTADVIHVRGMTGPDGVRGASPVGLCREALGLSASLTTAASALWANGAVPAGLLSVPAGTQAEEAVAMLAQAWSARHEGPTNRGRVAVLSGDIKFTAVTMPLADAQFIEQRRMSTAEVARIFRVPVSVIGGVASGDSMTYRNASAEAEQLVKFGLGPLLRLLEDALSADRELFPGETTGVEFDVDRALLRTDPATRAAIATQALAAGWMTVEEVREREGLGPLPPGHSAPNPAELQTFATALGRSGLRAGESGG
jgi:HK97 family phage portal protein